MTLLSFFSAVIIFLFTGAEAAEHVVPIVKPIPLRIYAEDAINTVEFVRSFSMKDVTTDDRNVSDLMRNAFELMNQICCIADEAISNKNAAAASLFKTSLGQLDGATMVGGNGGDALAEAYLKSMDEHHELKNDLTSIYDMFDTSEIIVLNDEIAVEFRIDRKEEVNANVEKMVSSSGCSGFLFSMLGRKK